MPAIVFVFIAAVAFGVLTVLQKLASPYINQYLGAIIVSATAVVIAAGALAPRLKDGRLLTNPKGIVFLMLAGFMAFLIDTSALRAYARGVPVTVGAPIIIGGSIVVATVIGFVLGEQISALKLFALFLILIGSGLLARFV